MRSNLLAWQKWLLSLSAALVALLLGAGIWGFWMAHQFPYGPRLACMPSVYAELRAFAQFHGGRFPASDAGPYDALGKLFPEYTQSGRELAGLSGNPDAAEKALREGKPLDTNTSSWVYVPGLTIEDDPRIAILWESRSGISASGRRAPNGSHAVLFVNGDVTNISRAEWSAFLDRQGLLRNRNQHPASAVK